MEEPKPTIAIDAHVVERLRSSVAQHIGRVDEALVRLSTLEETDLPLGTFAEARRQQARHRAVFIKYRARLNWLRQAYELIAAATEEILAQHTAIDEAAAATLRSLDLHLDSIRPRSAEPGHDRIG